MSSPVQEPVRTAWTGVPFPLALSCLAVAFTLITAGLVWLTGPWGLIASGLALGTLVLFVVDVKGGGR